MIDASTMPMNLTKTAGTLPPFIEATPVGLKLAHDLTFEEWSAIAASFGTALQTAAWCIGDWMVYGERRWGRQLLLEGQEFDPSVPGRIPSHVFDAAVDSTGLDRNTLSNYANVARKIPMDERRIHVSFGHHRILAPLPPAKRLEWWSLLDSESNKLPTVKRLALSVRTSDEPRLISDDEIMQRGEHAERAEGDPEVRPKIGIAHAHDVAEEPSFHFLGHLQAAEQDDAAAEGCGVEDGEGGILIDACTA
jgi:hypothetical protein